MGETATSEAEAAPDASPAAAEPAAAPPTHRAILGVVRRCVPPALELLALSSFVIARPVFGSLGRSPETFVARGADWSDVVVFALVVVCGPVLLAVGVELVAGLVFGERVRRVLHLAAVAVLLCAAAYQLAGALGNWERNLALTVGVVAGLVTVALWIRFGTVSTFVRYASVGAVVFLAQFLVMSPVSSIALGGRHAGADVGAVAVDDPPPVVLVVFDGLPTSLLLDGTGHIDADLYPNLAALAGDGTWYRNHTTVAQVTLQAVPAILSGTTPEPDKPPAVASSYPGNIFTLLRDTHEIHGGESITGLCPVSECPEEPGSPLTGLLHDAGYILDAQLTDARVDPEMIPSVFWNRHDRARDWIDSLELGRSGRPDLVVLHLLLPHPGWEYLDDGSPYLTVEPDPSGMFLNGWGAWGSAVGRQRHVLQMQATDALLGELLDRLREAGIYDDAVVAVTADHGYAFTDETSWRALSEDNYTEVMWTPLIVKAPGQTEGEIDDSNVISLDVLPTIAAELGIDELPWDADGAPAGTVDRDPEDKWIVDLGWATLRPDDGDDTVEVDGVEGFERVLAADPVEGTGPLAVWRRTQYGDLVGQRVDDLREGEPADPPLEVRGLDRWDDVDLDMPPLELVAVAQIEDGTTVAITVDGVVAATVPAEAAAYGVSAVHALLWPGALDSGRNEIGAYTVDGDPSAPVLHELDVRPRPDD